MKRTILKIIEKLFKIRVSRVKTINKQAYEPHIQKFIDSGNIKIGNNCKIEGSFLSTVCNLENEFLNIEIGDDCYILGSIELHSPVSKIKIGNRVFIGPRTNLFCRESIILGDDVMISWGCTLIDTNAHSLLSEERINDVLDWKKGWQHKNWEVVNTKIIIIKNNCWIGFNTIITKGVILEKRCVVASGSVVTKSFSQYSILGGNPAKFIKQTT